MDGLKLPVFLLILLLAAGAFLLIPSGQSPRKYKPKVKKTHKSKESQKKLAENFAKQKYEIIVSALGANGTYSDYKTQKMLSYSLAGLKRFDSAIVSFEKLLKIKRYPEDGYSLAYLYEITGRIGVSRMLYEELLSADMKKKLTKRIYEGLARTSNFENDTKSALKHSLAMVRKYPRSTLGFVTLFKQFKNMGKTWKLEKLIKRGDKYHKNTYEYNFWLGSLYFEIAKYEKALVRFKNCVNIDPSNSTPFYYTYRILKKQKDLEGALKELESYYDRNPLLPNVFFEAAIDAKNDGKIHLSYKFIRSALTMDRTLLGRDDNGTLQAVERFVRRNGKQIDKQFMEAFMSYVNGDTSFALKQAQTLLPIVKDTNLYPETNRIIGECYRLKSQDKEYANYLARLKKDKIASKQNINASKAISTVVDDGETKVDKIKQRAMMNPNDLKRQYLAGIQLARLGEIADAKVYFKNAIRLNPNILEPNFSMAKLCMFDKDYSKAKDYLKKALEISPNNSQTLSLSASAKYEMNDLRGAENDAKSSLLSNPNNGEAYLVLAELYSKNHRFDQAIEHIDQGLEVELNPSRRKRLVAIKNSIRSN